MGTSGQQQPTNPQALADFVKNGKRLRQERIERVQKRYGELGIKTHPGTITRAAMGKRLTATQFYKLQSQLPAQIPYALQDKVAEVAASQ
jgi:hypothetical protein